MDKNKVNKILKFANNKDLALYSEISEVNDKLEKTNEIFKDLDIKNLKLIKGEKGDKPVLGIDYQLPKDGKDGYTPIKGRDYFDGKDGKDGQMGFKGDKGDKGEPGKDGISSKDLKPDNPDDIKNKLEIKIKHVRNFTLFLSLT